MNESDTRLKLIDPALRNSSWDTVNQIYTEYYFTDGEIFVRGNLVARKLAKKADYLLAYKPNIPLAIIEAKDTQHSPDAGLQQGIGYAQVLKIPFAYSTNGKEFVEHDFLTGKETSFALDKFPTPNELWERYCKAKGLDDKDSQKIITAPYYQSHDSFAPRYYQLNAVNRTLEAIAQGRDRILLVMATGTGKTFTAFQIVHRLRQSSPNLKVLYLADRNILVDQTIIGDFKSLKNVTTKIKGRKLDSAFEVYFSLYQQLVSSEGEEIFREFDPDFFDLIIVDECHRGSAAEDSTWRQILQYFNSAIQIGMTATPKETKEVSNISYFGDPVYTYSLKQGIEDGFLAPYKVIRPKMNVDIYGYRPSTGTRDDHGEELPDRLFEKQDFDSEIVIKERYQQVAKKITQFLKETDRYAKTIVFCVDIEHAENMRRALVNENADIVKDHPTYVMKITGDDQEGKAQLDNFIDPDEKYPTIVTTSKLLTTGVNCQTCKLVVLDNKFGERGMTEFKQIIGRGTRIREDYGKRYFTILDFRDASRLFADPDFDGEPVVVFEPKEGEPIAPPPEAEGPLLTEDDIDSLIVLDGDTYVCPGISMEDESNKRIKYHVHGVDVQIVSERVEYYSSDGQLVTESLKDYTRKNILGEYETLDRFLNAWNAQEKKQAILDELHNHGVFLQELRRESGQDELSDFDLICHLAYDKQPLTRSERASKLKQKGALYKYEGLAREVLETLLDKYATSNLIDLDDTRVLDLQEFRRFGSPMKIVKAFGGKEQYTQAAQQLENQLYAS